MKHSQAKTMKFHIITFGPWITEEILYHLDPQQNHELLPLWFTKLKIRNWTSAQNNNTISVFTLYILKRASQKSCWLSRCCLSWQNLEPQEWHEGTAFLLIIPSLFPCFLLTKIVSVCVFPNELQILKVPNCFENSLWLISNTAFRKLSRMVFGYGHLRGGLLLCILEGGYQSLRFCF